MITVEQAYKAAVQANLPQLPLFEGARAGLFELLLLNERSNAWPAFVSKSVQPRIVVIGDDPWPAGESLGPEAWDCARAAKRWARSVIIHGTGPDPSHYRLAGRAAALHRFVVMVECGSEKADAWASFLDCPNTLRILPPAGKVHPSHEVSVH